MAARGPSTIQLGSWRVDALLDGYFRLDGGAMWGVVPAPLWTKMTSPDDRGRIRMALRPFLARCGEACVLIEPGIGDRWSDKELDRYGIERSPDVEQSLQLLGISPEEVTHVVATHGHWDHIGALVVERNGELVPRFPRAAHLLPQVELERLHNLDHVRRGSYRLEDIEVVQRAGLLEGFRGELEPLPGLELHELGGHSEGVSVVVIGEGNERAIFWSDVVPTTHHIQPPYIMAYDIDVVRSFEQRSAWLERAAEEGWIGLFYHDEQHAFGRIQHDGKRYSCVPLEA